MKVVKEIPKEHYYRSDDYLCKEHLFDKNTYNGIWHKYPEERPTKINKDYIVTEKGLKPFISVYEWKGNYFFSGDTILITAWTEFPEPYIGE